MSVRAPSLGLWTGMLLAAMALMLTTASSDAVRLAQSAASITVSPGQGPPGAYVTVTGSSWAAKAIGRIRWDGAEGTTLGSFSVNPNGAFSVGVTVPGNAPPGGHTIWACTDPINPMFPKICASRSFKVTGSVPTVPPATLPPATRPPATPTPTECDVRHVAGEVVIDFEGLPDGQNMTGTTLPQGVRFVGDTEMRVFSPSVATHSGSKALRMDYAGEFGSGGAMMRIRFTNVQDFVGMYVGLNEKIWATSPVTAALTAYALDGSAVGGDSVSFGPAATPIGKCLSVSAPGIVEITLTYGSAGEPEVIDDLVLRGPETPVPVPEDDEPPAVTILLPEDGAIFTDTNVRLQGEVREDRELAGLMYRVNTGEPHALTFTPAGLTSEGRHLYLFALDPLPVAELRTCGDNLVTVEATDTSGNTAWDGGGFQLYVGDLEILEAEAVQVLYGANLVRDKGTAFRVKVHSTFGCAVQTRFLLDLPDGGWSTTPVLPAGYRLPPGEYPDTWGLVTIPGQASDFAVMLPYVPEGQEGEVASSGFAPGVVRSTTEVVNPDIRVLPRPMAGTVRFGVEIDPQDSWREQDETNNRFDSPPLQVVTTRPYNFVGFQIRYTNDHGTCTPTEYQVAGALKHGVEYVLGVFPIADGKISAMVAPAMQIWNETEEDRGHFLGRIEQLAKSFAGDFGVALTCEGGGTSGGDSVFVGVDTAEETLAHEFNHVVVPMGDVYSLDCYCNWGESYCQLPDGGRFYCCYDESYDGGEDWVSKRATEEAMGVDPGQGCLLDCGQNETLTCDTCCWDDCGLACAEADGTRYWCPDGRTTDDRILAASDGFWPNRWTPEEGKLYFMDGPSGDNWMILQSMSALGQVTCWDASGIDVNGYADLLGNPRFLSASDPAALLVSGSITKDGVATLQPFQVLPEAFLDLSPRSSGAYTFLLKDASGFVLSRTGFDLSFWQSDPHGGPLDEAHFALRIEWVEGTRRIELLGKTGALLASRDVTPGAPEVEITNPAGGAVTAAKTVTIRWAASDPDGDALTYSLALSEDGGETWLPVAGRLEQMSYSLPVSAFEEGGGYLVKVLATDGVNTGSAVSAEPFTLVVGTPRVALYVGFVGLVALAAGGVVLIVLGLRPRRRRVGAE